MINHFSESHTSMYKYYVILQNEFPQDKEGKVYICPTWEMHKMDTAVSTAYLEGISQGKNLKLKVELYQ